MGQQSRIRVLVRHGEQLVEAGLVAILARHPDCDLVATIPPGVRDGVLRDWLTTHAIDIVVTDYDRGLWLADALQREAVPGLRLCTRTLIVTDRATQTEIRAALQHGVGGYLAITSPSDEIVEAVLKVHKGMRHVSERLAQSLIENMLFEQLTPREREVLGLAAQGCANKVIASRLRVELGTVKCHMKAVLDKLQASNRTEAVVIASQRGLLNLEAARPGMDVHATPIPAAWSHSSISTNRHAPTGV